MRKSARQRVACTPTFRNTPTHSHTLDKPQNALILFLRLCLANQINLVLEDDQVLQLHDFNRRKMFTGLRLRAAFVAGDEQEGGVHDLGDVGACRVR